MRLAELKIFCDLARCRSFSQAALMNGLTQSAVSQAIHQLEKRLGVQLVDRSTRPLDLTPLGRTFYEGSKSLLDQYAELEASIRNGPAGFVSNVQAAAIYSVGLRDMSRYMERFSLSHPGTEVAIEYLHPHRVYEKVLEGAADFGLVSFPKRTRELAFLPWRDEEMRLACAPSHPLTANRSIRLSQLHGCKYVGFDRDLIIRKKIDSFLRQRGVRVDVVLEFDNIENVKKALEVSDAVALLPVPMLQREVQNGILAAIPLADCRLIRPLGIIYRRHLKLSSTVVAFIDLLREPDESPDSTPNEGVLASGSQKKAAGRQGSGMREATEKGIRDE
jgi:DNA-binding transcriptional LysR family regulator